MTPPDHPESGPREFGVKAKSFFANWMAMHNSLEDAKDGSPKAEWCDIREYVSRDALVAAEEKIALLAQAHNGYVKAAEARCAELEESAKYFKAQWMCVREERSAAEARVKELSDERDGVVELHNDDRVLWFERFAALEQRAKTAERERDELREHAANFERLSAKQSAQFESVRTRLAQAERLYVELYQITHEEMNSLSAKFAHAESERDEQRDAALALVETARIHAQERDRLRAALEHIVEECKFGYSSAIADCAREALSGKK